MKTMFLTLLTAVFLVHCGGGAEEATPAPTPEPSPKSAPSAPSTGDSASLSGTAIFSGDVPAREDIQMASDPSCARMHTETVQTEFAVVADNGGLKNVFVYVKEGLEGQSFDVPSEAALLDQEGCLYKPRVFGVRAGQTLTISNSDETLHNIHAMPAANKEFNIGQPIKGLKTDKVFETPEVMVPFKCDVHKWMAAYVGVVDHPFFATTDSNGGFTIPDLPAGDYVIEAWHEKFGTQQANVTVGADGATADFTFSE